MADVSIQSENSEGFYGNLLGAGALCLWLAMIGCVVCMIDAFIQVGLTRIEAAIVLVWLGIGLVIWGVIVNGLIRLAVNVANDVHDELSELNEKTSTHTRLLASLANSATGE